MKLFALRDANHKLLREKNQVIYFPSKELARKHRITLIQNEGVYFVTYGIDHKLYKGNI